MDARDAHQPVSSTHHKARQKGCHTQTNHTQLGGRIGHRCASVGPPPLAAAWEAYCGGGATGRGAAGPLKVTCIAGADAMAAAECLSVVVERSLELGPATGTESLPCKSRSSMHPEWHAAPGLYLQAKIGQDIVDDVRKGTVENGKMQLEA
ncbi:hypothetical protein B0T21DRAFT_348757 [Apiosordaria backusii]|uniref:Uncharacterized protein n=1 Tax=Apiosordaria backusii TaxID=314023 RepID=A0AA40EFR6_9PEZI|nr:hypothetical protein B0T21DRAFT_348757 [Apiosordaria backusii]